ncbi:fasciclin domain-containing protein [Methanosarcina sp. T3]|uniref:fasciclin domain-containing protein n=1 Tax=Methanosarcina sp. T3 TaxID=3439062 RepID=UPI003F87FD50
MLLLSAATCTCSAQDDGTTTTLDLIGKNGNFTLLSGFFNNSSLNTTLAGEEPYTVFAPTDAAFNNVSEDALEALKEDPAALEQVLLYHVTNETLMSEDLANVSNVTTLQGSELPVNVTEEGIFVGDAKVIVQDINASNGVIHAIDAVLIPPEKEEQNLTVLYNDTVNLTEGNVIFRPNTTRYYTIDNLTDFGALYATGLDFNATLAQNMTGYVTNMTNVSFVLESLEGVENNNITGKKWFIYINGEPAKENLGMNPISDGDNLSFWYTKEEDGKALIENATYAANITIAVEERMEPEPEQNLTILYNDTVNLTEGNFTFMPANDTQNYTIDNLTDFGALYATGLELNVSVMQNMTDGDMAANETEDMNGNETEDMNRNETEDMNGNETEDMNGNETEDMNGNETEDMTDNMTNVSFVLEGIEGVENNNTTGEKWFPYINGEPAEADFGMNPVNDGDNLSFWYTTEEGGEALIENATYVVNITVSKMMARETIIQVAQNQTRLTAFVNATQAANLTQALNETGPFTVCIPSNEAFEQLPAQTRDQLMNNTTLLREVLSYHMIRGKYAREQLAGMNTVNTVQGRALQIKMEGDNLTIQNATVTQIIIVSNGVICIIDKVLIPPDSGLPSDENQTGNQIDENQTGNQIDGNQTDGNQTDGNQTANQTDGNQTEDKAGDWHFFSIPFEANNTSVDYLLSDVNYTSLIYYNASNKLFEDVSNIEPLKGYWINVPNGTEFNASEQFASVEKKQVNVPPSLQTYPGWNALGSPVNETVSAETAFTSLNNSYAKIVGPWVPGNNTTGYYRYVGYNGLNETLGENQFGTDEFEVEPYKGYWVFVRNENLYA